MNDLITVKVPVRALPHLPEVAGGRQIPCLGSGPSAGIDVVMTRWKKGFYLSGEKIPSGEKLLAEVRKHECTEEVVIVACQIVTSFAEHAAKRIGVSFGDYLLSCVGYNLWHGEGRPPLDPPKRETAFSRFEAALKEDHRREQQEARDAAKLEPLTIVITDQQELKRIYALAKNSKSNPVPFLRRHLRVWSREELETHRLEHSA